MLMIFFICTGVNDHEYVIYDPRDDSEEDWDYWNLICRVIFNIALLSPQNVQTYGWSYKQTILVVLTSSLLPSDEAFGCRIRTVSSYINHKSYPFTKKNI